MGKFQKGEIIGVDASGVKEVIRALRVYETAIVDNFLVKMREEIVILE